MTGETCTPLQALSNGKENIVHILPFCLSVPCTAENAKPHESKTIVGAALGSAHYNPLTSTIPTTPHGTYQTDLYIVLRSDHSGKVAAYTTGKFTIPGNCIIPALTPWLDGIPGHLQVPKSPSKSDSYDESDSDDDSPDSNSSNFGQLTPGMNLNNVPQLQVQRYSPEATPNSDNDSDSPPHLDTCGLVSISPLPVHFTFSAYS